MHRLCDLQQPDGDGQLQHTRADGTDSGGGNIVPTGTEVGNGTGVAATSKVFTQGQLTQTGEKLDIAIQGDGFFEVQRPDGTIGFTRAGSFKLNASGSVVTVDGLPVLSGFQPILPGASSVASAPTFWDSFASFAMSVFIICLP